jgi:hypothetical protein
MDLHLPINSHLGHEPPSHVHFKDTNQLVKVAVNHTKAFCSVFLLEDQCEPVERFFMMAHMHYLFG